MILNYLKKNDKIDYVCFITILKQDFNNIMAVSVFGGNRRKTNTST